MLKQCITLLCLLWRVEALRVTFLLISFKKLMVARNHTKTKVSHRSCSLKIFEGLKSFRELKQAFLSLEMLSAAFKGFRELSKTLGSFRKLSLELYILLKKLMGWLHCATQETPLHCSCVLKSLQKL